MKSILTDWILKKWTVADLNLYPGNIGFNGRVKDSGFMYDGSYYDGGLYREPALSGDYEFSNTENRIVYGKNRFEWGDHIDDDTLNQLENLLSYCREHGIKVIGFLAPFAPHIYDMMRQSGNYNYLNEIEVACCNLFNLYNFEFYNYMDGESLEVTDDCFLDGFHGSELVYGRILEKMVMDGSDIKQNVDLGQIHSLIQNAYSGYTFENPFSRANISE